MHTRATGQGPYPVAPWTVCANSQGHETVNFRAQKVKDQGHTRRKIDLDAWRIGIIIKSFFAASFYFQMANYVL